MRQSLKDTYPKLFRTMLVPKAEELVATPYRFEGSTEKARDFFEDGMLHTCQQIYQYAREDVPVTIYYAYKQSDTDEREAEKQTASTGWETMLSAIIKAGFDFSQITWSVNEEKQIIRVTLPPVRILSHEIDLDSFKLYHEAESIFRQVTLDEHNAALTQMKKTAEQSAINNGLFEDAIQNAKTLLYGFFSQQYDLSQYQLEFSEQ
mgnify:CR=1 FL=1